MVQWNRSVELFNWLNHQSKYWNVSLWISKVVCKDWEYFKCFIRVNLKRI